MSSALLASRDFACFFFTSNSKSTTLSKGSAENSDGNSLLTIAMPLLWRLFKLRYICRLLIGRLSMMFLAVSGPFVARWTYTSASVRERPKPTSASIIRSKLNHFHFLRYKNKKEGNSFASFDAQLICCCPWYIWPAYNYATMHA